MILFLTVNIILFWKIKFMKILAVGGNPGVGKSTLFRFLISNLGEGVLKRHGVVDYHLFGSVAILGKYAEGEDFGGTDKLSMSCFDDAEEFISTAALEGIDSVAYEGDRLFCSRFLKYCSDWGNLRPIVLTAQPSVLSKRRNERSLKVGSAQNPTWLKGRETKVAKISNEFLVEELEVQTEQTAIIAAENFARWLKC